jgi:hypothetical protein
MPTPEEKARELIDAMLAASGWVVQSYREMNLGAGLGLAVTEFPGAHGPADYLLYVDGKAIGVVEAKPVGHTLKGVEGQSASYSDGLPESLPAWRRPLPLSHEQRVVYCAFLFDAEVCNGGLMQFFGNSSGDHAVDALEALSELGHKEAHAALRDAIKLVGPLARETNRELRLTGFEGRWEELQPAFDPLEQAYYATQAQLRQAWLLYAIRHAEHFRR